MVGDTSSAGAMTARYTTHISAAIARGGVYEPHAHSPDSHYPWGRHSFRSQAQITQRTVLRQCQKARGRAGVWRCAFH